MDVKLDNIFYSNCDKCIKEGYELFNKDIYISKRDYQKYLDKYKEIFDSIYLINDNNDLKKQLVNLSNNIDNIINEHNSKFISRKLVEYKDYFDNLFKDIDPNILLDEEQRKAILIDEDYSLVIAGAGSGKTTTMTAKVKYLVDKCNINPEEIVVLSFTDKAVEEFDNRINDDFKLDIEVKTFHKLGLKILNDRLDVKVGVVGDGRKHQILYDYFKEKIFPNKKLLEYYLNNFSKYLKISHESLKYNTFDEYYDYYVDYKYNKEKEHLKEFNDCRIKDRLKYNRSIKNEELKSQYETIIANFLYINGVDYKYEQRYKESEKSFSYQPDFTVSLPDGKNIYIEFYGLNNYQENGLYSDKQILEYQNLIKKKKILHEKYGTDLIELFPDNNSTSTNYLKVLANELEKRGIFFVERTDKEIFLKIMETSKNSQLINFVNMVTQFISQFKCNNYNEDDFQILINKTNNNLVKLQLVALKEIYSHYNRTIHSENLIDFEDMINLATLAINKINLSDSVVKYKYIIVDEFQDISQQRFDLLQCVSDFYDAKIIGVGDDWQAIFGFSGAKIDLFTNFCRLMGYGEIIKITNTYRNSQELIDIAGEFVLRNSDQFKKYLHSPKHLSNPIEIIYYNKDNDLAQAKILEKLVLSIYKENPKYKILILGRYNADKERITGSPLFNDGVIKNNEIIYVKNRSININYLTIHSAKGLGYDQVILINAIDSSENGFPSKIKDDPIISILKDGVDGNIEFAEERRLFYVAITRTKNKVYILAPDSELSCFIKEIREYSNVIENREFLEELGII